MQKKPTPRRGSGRTIHDVARLAGVSPMTVSRVINGEGSVRTATRAKVTEAIRAIGYAPNPAARNLARARNVRVGLIYSVASAYLSEVLLGALDQAGQLAIQLVVEKGDPERGEDAAAEHLIASGVDGVLLPPPLCDSPVVVERLAAAGLPMVAVASARPRPGVSSIGIDDYRAAQAMTRHLIALGHQRIGFIRGHPVQSASRIRHEGFVATLSEYGLPIEDELFAQGYFTYHSGLDAGEQLLSLSRPPTAIFASNDDMGAAVVAVAHRKGLDVPRDLTVVGFDDTTLATSVWPPLTTIRQPVSEMAHEAVRVMADLIRRREEDGEAGPPVRETMDFTLIRRQSDGHPSAVVAPARKLGLG